ncbi:hypothetical protein GGR92_001784 [Spirosoma lacussanchae]
MLALDQKAAQDLNPTFQPQYIDALPPLSVRNGLVPA